jgi:hypothetical protein
MAEYIYLLQEREFINLNKPIYKIGKTKQENLKRFSNYPKGSKLLLQIICNNCSYYEKQLLQKFKSNYELQLDIGYEYFKGNYKKMIKDIYEIVNDTNDDINHTYDINYTNDTNDTNDTNNTNDIIDTYEKLIIYTKIKTITLINKETFTGYLKLDNKWYYFQNNKKFNSYLKSLNNNNIDIIKLLANILEYKNNNI